MVSDNLLLARAAKAYAGKQFTAIQLVYLRLALQLLHDRSVLDDILQAAEGGELDIDPNDLIWLALQPDILAHGYSIPTNYSLGSDISTARFQTPARDFTAWRTMVATECGSGHSVMLEIAWVSGSSSREVQTYEMLLSKPHVEDPRNPVLKETQVFDIYDQQRTTVVAKLLVMPLMTELDHLYIRVQISRLDCVRQMMESLAFLHSLGICHGDIHLSNMVTTRRPPFRVYFIDFDLSRIFESRSERCLVKWEGGKIMPPEVEDDPDVEYDPFAADIYALGSLWRVFHGRPPLLELSMLCDFLHEENPLDRPTAEMALQVFDLLYPEIPWCRLLRPAILLGFWWKKKKSRFFLHSLYYLRDLAFICIFGARGRKTYNA